MIDMKARIEQIADEWANDPAKPEGEVLYEMLYEAGRKDENEACAVSAAIHSNYPIESDWDRGYAKGRIDAGRDVRAHLPKAPTPGVK